MIISNTKTEMTSKILRLILSTSSAIIGKDNKILLIQRENEPYKGRWCFPGGKIKEGEDYLTATKREVKEETGCDIVIPQWHLLKITQLVPYLIITSISEPIKCNSNKTKYTHNGIPCEWMTIDKIKALSPSLFVPGIYELIPQAFKLKNFLQLH